MNKQEAIKEIKNLKGLTILDKTINFDDEMISKKEVLNIVKQIDKLEKLYTVEIPNPGATLHFVLRKYKESEVSISYYSSDNWRDHKCTHLTEAEIKKDFAWAWQFAEEVEE